MLAPRAGAEIEARIRLGNAGSCVELLFGPLGVSGEDSGAGSNSREFSAPANNRLKLDMR